MSEYKLTCFNHDENKKIADFLKSAGILAYPSESVWGLGCDAFNEKAIKKILDLKMRPIHKGLIVLTDKVEKIMPLLCELDDTKKQAICQKIQTQKNLYQATTWLIPVAKSANIPAFLTGDFSSLAVRITAHPVLQRICASITDDSNPYGFLVSTSCNLQGQNPALTLDEAKRYFADKNQSHQIAYLNAQSLGFDKPSQIIDALTGQVIR